MATTTIDTKSLTDLITEFQRITAKDAITPENLGYILQRIADLLATAGTSETSAVLMQWYNALSKAAHYVSIVAQGTPDRCRPDYFPEWLNHATAQLVWWSRGLIK